MVEVFLVLVPPTSSTKNTILVETGNMGVLSHLRVIKQDPLCRRHSVIITQLLFWVVLNLVLVMVMVKLVWVLRPTTLPPRKLIVGLIVVIFDIKEYVTFICE